MRALVATVVLATLSVILSLSKDCIAQTHATQPHGTAFINLSAIEAMPEMRAFVAAYDRESGSLKATQNVPQLTDTRPIAQHQGEVAINGSREANRDLDALRTKASHYSPRLPDAASVRTAMETNYGREASTVQTKAAGSLDAYRAALARETQTAIAHYRDALNTRVNQAYAARAQQLHEKEAELEIRLDRADADQDLVLHVKLANLKGPRVNRAALQQRLQAIESRENRAIAALRARDAQTLAAYRAQLVAQAQRDDAMMVSELQHKAQANWHLRQRVAQAQQQAPQRLAFPALDASGFNDRWAQFGTDAQTTSQAFTESADDISRRFSVIGQMDSDARASASNEIIALQRYRSAFGGELAREAHAIAQRIAAQRGLTLVDSRQPGAVDLTPAVVQQLSQIIGP